MAKTKKRKRRALEGLEAIGRITETPLANDFRNGMGSDTVGPASSTRSVTRATSAKSVVPLEATDTETVSVFDYFRLEGPPAGKESQGNITTRNTRNIVKIADIMDTVEGRVRRLERNVDNVSTELKVRTGVRTAGDSDNHSPPAEAGRGHVRRDSDSTGSVGTVDEIEALGDRVQEIDERLDNTVSSTEDHEVRIQELDSCVHIKLETQLASLVTPEFSILEMSTALSEQFKVVKRRHDELGDVVKSQGIALAKANKQHDLTMVEMQATIRRLESLLARRQLAPTTPPHHARPHSLPRALVRSRSRSPEMSSGAKRFHGHSPQDKPFIVMGPVEITESTHPLQILHIYMNAHLPKFALPEPPRIDVIRDPREADHLRIFMSAADVRALKNAWVDKGFNSRSVRMVTMGLDDGPASNSVASASGTGGISYGRYSKFGNPGSTGSRR
ncbi:hypothetical protein K438DRAFT_1995829 [Mycena galopus ATCC 62051]|nr:hypothetical protein K438DRAFT_1995829 [Mycena galopus ATCC 62051]